MNEPLLAIPSDWLKPGAVVPVDAQTVDHLLRFIQGQQRNLANYKRLEAILRDQSDVNYEGDGPNAAMSILMQWEGPG